jgi:dUTP pyrophosphatase
MLPHGTYGRIAPRSGLAWKNYIDVGAGVIDEDFTGKVQVLLFNHSDVDFAVEQEDRIAQLIIERIKTPPVVEVFTIGGTERGSGGFGSTGISQLKRPRTD